MLNEHRFESSRHHLDQALVLVYLRCRPRANGRLVGVGVRRFAARARCGNKVFD